MDKKSVTCRGMMRSVRVISRYKRQYVSFWVRVGWVCFLYFCMSSCADSPTNYQATSAPERTRMNTPDASSSPDKRIASELLTPEFLLRTFDSSFSAKRYSFQKDIIPLLDRYFCNNVHCHGSSAGRFAINVLEPKSIYQYLYLRPSSQNSKWLLLVPYKPQKSLFYLKMVEEAPPVGKKMGNLPWFDILKIQAWILEGAKYN